MLAFFAIALNALNIYIYNEKINRQIFSKEKHQAL